MATHTCPRRAEGGPFSAGVGKDRFRSGHGVIGQRSGCTYCGSMSSDDFMAAVLAGAEIGPTDKNYKVYVDGHHGKFYFQHLSVDQQYEFIALLNARTVNVGYPGHFQMLPFFVGARQKGG